MQIPKSSNTLRGSTSPIWALHNDGSAVYKYDVSTAQETKLDKYEQKLRRSMREVLECQVTMTLEHCNEWQGEFGSMKTVSTYMLARNVRHPMNLLPL